MNSYDELINAVVAIKADEELRQRFIQILKFGPYTKEGRVEKVLQAASQNNAPPEVTRVLSLLKNDKLATLFLNALESGPQS